jgi:hypothetical protein
VPEQADLPALARHERRHDRPAEGGGGDVRVVDHGAVHPEVQRVQEVTALGARDVPLVHRRHEQPAAVVHGVDRGGRVVRERAPEPVVLAGEGVQHRRWRLLGVAGEHHRRLRLHREDLLGPPRDVGREDRALQHAVLRARFATGRGVRDRLLEVEVQPDLVLGGEGERLLSDGSGNGSYSLPRQRSLSAAFRLRA